MRILLTNDDGPFGPGLVPLYHSLRQLGEVSVVCPAQEQSGAGHSITVLHPLREHRVELAGQVPACLLTGTPADCVKFAVLRAEQDPFDLVVSGINLGLNAGVDVFYSGTVAGAMEGALHGIGSVAVSTDRANAQRLDRAAQLAADVVAELVEMDLHEGWLMNVNIPRIEQEQDAPPVRYTRQSPVFPEGVLSRTNGTRGRVHYWLDADVSAHHAPGETDVAALKAGHISVTPLARSLTDDDALSELQRINRTGGDNTT